MANQVVITIQSVLRRAIPQNMNHIANKKKKTCKPVDEKEYLEGTVDRCGTPDCILSNERGGVYGFAIRLKTREDKKNFYNHIIERGRKRNNISLDEWNSIGNNYYPLYWGKDVNLGFRLYEHTKNSKTCASIALSEEEFYGYEIIYGAVLCDNRDVYEGILHNDYKDLLRNL